MSIRDGNLQRDGNLSGYRLRPENGNEIKGSSRKVTEVTKVTGVSREVRLDPFLQSCKVNSRCKTVRTR